MEFLSLVLLAIGLSIDSLIISVSNGLSVDKCKLNNILLPASLFAGFHAIMLLLGYYLGIGIAQYIKSIDHWVAFGLLFIIGAKVIIESFTKENNNKKHELSTKTLIGQAFATSIDALAVGISFALFNYSIIVVIITVSVVVFIFTILGMKLGNYVGNTLNKKLEILSGLLLIAVGVKILIEHLMN